MMDTRQRAALSLVLAIIVAVTLLPTALNDGTGNGDDAAAAEPGDDADATTTTSTVPSNGGDGDGATPTSTVPPNGTPPDSTTTTTTSSVPPVTTPPPLPPDSDVTLGARAIGSLIPDRNGVVAATISNSAATPRIVIVTVQVTMATVVTVNDPACFRSVLTVTCTLEVGSGASVDLSVTVLVEAGATEVGVTVSASVAGADPPPLTVSLPTSSAGIAARLAQTGQIDAAVIGNTLASCVSGASVGATTCAAVRDGTAATALTNDDWTMAAVAGDLRGFGSSSSAALTDVDPDSVVSATLMWAASTTTTTPPPAGSVRFATPTTTGGATPNDNGDYVDIAADDTVSIPGGWQSVADVTSLVSSAGVGDYWVADVAADLGGSDAWAGWVLVVVHESAGPVRDVVVFDGIGMLDSTPAALSLPTTSDPVTAGVVVVSWDGDRDVTGEDFRLTHSAGSIELTNAINPPDDVANSSISSAGAAVTSGQPSYDNTLGVDIDRFELGAVSGSLEVVASSADDDVLLGTVVAVLAH